MIQILLMVNDETREKAIKSGFVEKTVLVKENGCQSTEKNKADLERQCRDLRPYQFLVSDYWGMGPE